MGVLYWALDLVNFVPAVAYHFCLNLPANFSQPGNGNLAHPCRQLDYHCCCSSNQREKTTVSTKMAFAMKQAALDENYRCCLRRISASHAIEVTKPSYSP